MSKDRTLGYPNVETDAGDEGTIIYANLVCLKGAKQHVFSADSPGRMPHHLNTYSVGERFVGSESFISPHRNRSAIEYNHGLATSFLHTRSLIKDLENNQSWNP